MDVSDERFDQLVGEALDGLPAELAAAMRNVAVAIEDASPDGDLLGLYEGIPLTQRTNDYGMVLPDTITIYQADVLAACETEQDVVDEVRVTVVHEVAHHFGIDDDRLHELGWG